MSLPGQLSSWPHDQCYTCTMRHGVTDDIWWLSENWTLKCLRWKCGRNYRNSVKSSNNTWSESLFHWDDHLYWVCIKMQYPLGWSIMNHYDVSSRIDHFLIKIPKFCIGLDILKTFEDIQNSRSEIMHS